jgi:hypothetical protein
VVAKILTVAPLLVLSGMFFAAGIVEGGILFVVFAGVMVWAYLRGGIGRLRTSRAEALDLQTRAGPGPGPGGSGGA